ncbi:ACT domain-containing protein [Candidatus Aerophobetes bacterium]|uniref:Amino acid-binding protein n=1 Tax=Aerophobetes bacterium TaxID=2030807 RepID=A0A662DDB0_UNCAE|nr:ACT domain-containing protein [Candidatus Aerophobetes bacterium]RLE12858.1 MAG: amino acid-binding protein [Candidatus Aerophobetes bacterium]
MLVKQISVFLENKIGRLAEITELLGQNKINIRALAIADTTEFGILRLIVDNPEKAQEVLEDRGFAAKQTDVIVVKVADKPGGLAGILKELKKSDLNVEYLYAFVKQSGENALVVFRIENTSEAIKVLQGMGVEIISPEEIYSL